MNYVIVLTDGEDNDYGVKRVYLSDHKIDADEWSAEMKTFNNRVNQAHEAAYAKRGMRYGYGFNTDAHADYIAFMATNHPLKAFVEKHRLVPIEYTELWTWGLQD